MFKSSDSSNYLSILIMGEMSDQNKKVLEEVEQLREAKDRLMFENWVAVPMAKRM